MIKAILLVGFAAVVAALAWRLARSRRRARLREDPANDYAVRRDWSGNHGKLNHSSFVYFDADRDGRYGLGDRPMAGIMVRLHDGDGRFVAAARSNRGGFANFLASTKRRAAPIHVPGSYRFTVSLPPGWRSSSANEVQSQHLRPLPGSPTGLVSEAMLQPVGLFAIRRLSGRVADGVSASISVMAKGQEVAVHPLSAGAGFRLDLPDDADAIEVTGDGMERRLALSAYPTELGLLSPENAAVDSAAPLQAIGFDDVTTRGLRKVPSGYAGLTWFNLNALARDHTEGSEGYVNGNISGDHVCYTSSGHPAELSSDKPFGFHSVMLTAAWLKSEGETALVESWLGDRLIASDTIVLSAMAPVHYAPMLAAVTRVRLSTSHYWQLVLDDLVVVR
ncbi:hypothetical protein [Mesorhizobium sp. M0292]|uniref:hypothetical protein n=1 Tax=unclassified Mesorhizobium TaxID=325217 RepID=UPI00333AA7D6